MILTPQAENDFEDAYSWYENQDPGLGKEFARCVDVKLTSILRVPHQYQLIYENTVRRALVGRFPFSIYFVDEEDSVTVFAVLHQHRNPEIWESRI
ncbi:MAG: type II toxin-antitoxin system RelE/ParE family toxin [Gracilimonas sp.]|uniref:type II toxin-antitoxin system RelE/ParE family toxin n=1 Tax=Gracilimonas sp. TaxID=1974203 RepID=UPI0019C695A0|nr:type II toxin-antitoxin system RelE/ParE family toxin [Gracilimonas sp.]MBD3614976.1 type II toxin-antitoxin system RelE/ParE family toxin [Gracilimonas sp.]